jgi:two-component sensor histidine kinase
MSSSISAREPVFQFHTLQAFKRDTSDQRRSDAFTAELQASLAREDVLRAENRDLTQRQVMLIQEFEHRVTNGLQLIAGLLASQSRTRRHRRRASN